MSYYVYILTNHSRMLYVGVTDDIKRRTFEHKTGYFEASFTDRYKVDQLVYFEEIADAPAASAREKQLKGWSRKKKIALIEQDNPRWLDLAEKWFAITEIETGVMKGSMMPTKREIPTDFLASPKS
jgi:putative endonuclease